MMQPVGAVERAVWRLMQPIIMSLSSLCCIVIVGFIVGFVVISLPSGVLI